MKYLHIILFAIFGMLTACNNHSEDRIYQSLKIVKEFEPQSEVIDWGNMTYEERQKYPRKGLVINSKDDFPDESNINVADLKLIDIDFAKYSLLVQYSLIPGYIKGHRLDWCYDNSEEEYVFKAYFNLIHPDEEVNPKDDLFTYYRAAILVNKIPNKKVVTFSSSY